VTASKPQQVCWEGSLVDQGATVATKQEPNQGSAQRFDDHDAAQRNAQLFRPPAAFPQQPDIQA
jgi:hypothetical protein